MAYGHREPASNQPWRRHSRKFITSLRRTRLPRRSESNPWPRAWMNGLFEPTNKCAPRCATAEFRLGSECYASEHIALSPDGPVLTKGHNKRGHKAGFIRILWRVVESERIDAVDAVLYRWRCVRRRPARRWPVHFTHVRHRLGSFRQSCAGESQLGCD